MAAVAVGILAFDFFFPLGIAAGIPYLALVLMALRWNDDRALYGAAAIATVLTLAKYAVMWAPDTGLVPLVNRLLTVSAFWLVAESLVRHRRRERRSRTEAEVHRDRVRQREEEIARLRDLEAVAAGLAHHFNNALSSAMALADSIEPATPEDAETLSRLAGQHDKAAATVHRLIQCLGEDGEQAEPVALLPLVETVASEFDGVAMEVGGDREVAVPIDPLGFSAALREILLNAKEAGARAIVMTVSRPAQPGAPVVVSVTDDGCGLDEAGQAHAGTPFFSTKGPGRLGLGLLGARVLMARVGGTLEIASSPAGTRVEIRLPSSGIEPAPQ